MSIRSRVEKLESACGADFRVAVPTLLDCSGNCFESAPDDLGQLRSEYKPMKVLLWFGESREARGDFQRRVNEIVSDELNPTVILTLGAEFL